MSVRDKTEEIVEQGRKARGEYDPAPGSFPLKAYLFWNRNTKHPRTNENFCHYWRVVLIWAPLMVVRLGFRKVGNAIVNLLPEGKTKTEADWDAYFEAQRQRERDKSSSPKWRWVAYRFFRDHGQKVAAGFLAFVIAAMLVGIGAATQWWIPLVSLAVVATVIGLVVGLAFLVAWFQERKEAAEEAARDARWEYYYKHGVFPERPAEKEFEFPDWVYKIVDPALDALGWVGEKLGNFFRAIGEILVLLVQAIRVSKWKICPLVKIPGSEPAPVRDFYTEDEMRYY